MATKKNPALTIERKCPKCGTVTTYNLINLRELRQVRKSNELAKENGDPITVEPGLIYMCECCGHKIVK